MSNLLKTIIVDITPILPGGENGGAKVFVLELLSRLADMAPSTQFILLTQASAHDELQMMDRENMSRRMITRVTGKKSFLARGVAYIFRKLPRIPQRFSLLGYRIHARLRRHAIKQLLNEVNADLVFCPFTAPTYVTPGIPTVCTIYDLQYKTYPAFFDAEDIANRSHAFTEACRRSSMLVAISDYSRQTAMKHGGVKPEHIQTVHLRMAKRIATDTPTDNALLNKLGLVSQHYLLYPANYWMHKNHEMLLTAFKMACHQGGLGEDIKLVFTGAPGERQRWLLNAAKNMKLESRVLFLGYLNNQELATVMNNCAGVVFPSLYEGFGLPILEAMAAGVPVACSNTTSLPEVAEHAAIFFDPRIPTQIAEAMITLVSDFERRKRLVSAGQERVALFSDSNHMAKEYWDIFQRAFTGATHSKNATVKAVSTEKEGV
ncbi:MAG: glycosyltransferase family 1 protein [Legionellaceae bacterium]|nr:glycosyltransferase family 1 protein [Legionellaceae bacterium]